jgi:hypothetical protein
MRDIMSAASIRVPALSEYASKQEEKIMWRMIGDGLAQIPVFTESPQLQIWYLEQMIRSLRVGEDRVQEALAAAQQGIIETRMQQMLAAVPPEVGGGQGAKGQPPGQSQVAPAGVAQSANLTPLMAG